MRTQNIKSSSTKIIKNLSLIFLSVFFISCDREVDEEIISVTPPELHVIVYLGEDDSARITGSEVILYNTEEDRTNGINEISRALTDSNGVAIFAENDFKRGVLYISASKESVIGQSTTPYLLQNDGKTYVWISAM